MTPFFWFRWIRRVVSLLVVLALVGTAFTAFNVWWTSRQDDRSPADVLLVLGAAQFDGDPSPVFESRLRHAKELYDDGVAGRIITLGGSRVGDRFTEAEAGRNFLVALGAAGGDVIAVGEGDDTRSSLQAGARQMAALDLGSAVVVTDPLHSLRARTMARDLGIDAWTSPARARSSRSSQPNGMRYVARETGGLLVYYLRHRPFVDAVV